MTHTRIYHNPRCSKSRQTLAVLTEKGLDPEIVLYLETPPSPSELSEILSQLGYTPRQLLRTGEAIYKELNLKNSNHSDAEIIQLMCQHPKLIERPIVIHQGNAKIGRPPESVLDIL